MTSQLASGVVVAHAEDDVVIVALDAGRTIAAAARGVGRGARVVVELRDGPPAVVAIARSGSRKPIPLTFSPSEAT